MLPPAGAYRNATPATGVQWKRTTTECALRRRELPTALGSGPPSGHPRQLQPFSLMAGFHVSPAISTSSCERKTSERWSSPLISSRTSYPRWCVQS
jgi:hypothetical protein